MEVVQSIRIQKIPVSKITDVDFDNIPFGRVFSDHMLVANYRNGVWEAPEILPYDNIRFLPPIPALHYGQSIFEGLKAYKDQNGDPVLFRPEANYRRMNQSADRLCMPQIPDYIFMDGLKSLINLDRQWIPNAEGSSLSALTIPSPSA